MNTSQRILLKLVAAFLISKNGSTTTLEIKDELRRRFPKLKWHQSDISQAMIDAYDTQTLKGLTFTDTGEFRIYQREEAKELVFSEPVRKVTADNSKLSRTAIVDLMRESKGKFYTVTFIKADGSERVINGQTRKDNFMDNLGYINFRESNSNLRRVNPKTIKEISISGNIYKVK